MSRDPVPETYRNEHVRNLGGRGGHTLCATLFHLVLQSLSLRLCWEAQRQGTGRRTKNEFQKSEELLERRCGMFSPRGRGKDHGRCAHFARHASAHRYGSAISAANILVW